MAGPTIDTQTLTDLFTMRSITVLAQRIRQDLEWADFEKFVAFTFERAGYPVENSALQFGQGIDLKLYSTADMGGRPLACVSVKHHKLEESRVGIGVIRDFQTAVQSAGIPIGYIITNTDFTQPAYDEAQNWPKLRLINGNYLLRYVSYVRGTQPRRPIPPPIHLDVLLQADAIPIRHPGQTKVVTVANNKGGVGKTTTALYLAKRIAEHEQRVLLVDFDSQINLTQTLPNPEGEHAAPLSLEDYFDGDRKLHEVVRPTELKRVYLIPSQFVLRVMTAAMASNPQAELQFVSQLHAPEVRPPHYLDGNIFDWIIIDTPPEMTLRTRAALAASHYVLTPTEVGVFEYSGLDQLLDTVQTMSGLIGRPIPILGCVLTKWKDDKAHKDGLQQLKQTVLTPNGITLFETKIPYDINVWKDEANYLRIPGLSAKPAAQRYTELAEEVIAHVSNA